LFKKRVFEYVAEIAVIRFQHSRDANDIIRIETRRAAIKIPFFRIEFEGVGADSIARSRAQDKTLGMAHGAMQLKHAPLRRGFDEKKILGAKTTLAMRTAQTQRQPRGQIRYVSRIAQQNRAFFFIL